MDLTIFKGDADQLEEMINDLSPLEIRDLIQKIEDKMIQDPGHTVGDACPLKHSFGKGLYVREIVMPQGYLSTTRLHRFAHPAFVLRGTVSVVEEAGVKRVKGPCYFITKAGTKRIVYCHTEVVWVTVHATEQENVDDIVQEVTAESFDELREGGASCQWQ